METWLKLSLLLCVFGFMKEIRPSEPYITPYLEDQMKSFTNEDIEKIFSTGTYAYLGEIIFVFLVTDLLRYKPIIILDGVFAIITWCLLIWGEGVPIMQVMEVFYSFFMAAEVAYYTYIYAQVDKEHYQKVTSHTRAAFLFGRALSGVMSQILVSTNALDYYHLNFITLSAVTFAAIWAWFLPPVKHSIYFFRAENSVQDKMSGIENQAAVIDDSEGTGIETKRLNPYSEQTFEGSTSRISQNDNKGFINRCKTASHYIWKDFTAAYSNPQVIKWSFWWALATCGFLQVLNYVQLKWQEIINNNPQNLYNGAAEASYTVIGAVASLSVGWLRFNWLMLGEITLAVCSIIEGVLLIFTSRAENMMVAYICYVLFGAIYHTMITVANAQIAKHLTEDSYGLIFGVNTFVALVLQVILTLAVVDEVGLALDTSTQFLVYGGYYMVLGALFALMAIITLSKKDIRKQKIWLPVEVPVN